MLLRMAPVKSRGGKADSALALIVARDFLSFAAEISFIFTVSIFCRILVIYNLYQKLISKSILG